MLLLKSDISQYFGTLLLKARISIQQLAQAMGRKWAPTSAIWLALLPGVMQSESICITDLGRLAVIGARAGNYLFVPASMK